MNSNIRHRNENPGEPRSPKKHRPRFGLALSMVIILSPLGANQSWGITRVKSAPEVGRHVLQLDLGMSGAFEELTEGGKLAWSVGWSYHADRSLGIGLTVGQNKPEELVFANNTMLATQFTYLAATVNVRSPSRAGLIPMARAGFGYYDTKFEAISSLTGMTLDSESEGRFGMFFGLGLDYLLTDNISLGIVGDYHFISLEGPQIYTEQPPLTSGLGAWYDTWDIKAVVSFYSR